MSGYESAPATVMLATRCVVCGRPLVDANSAEAGMGPDCRERYGKADAVGANERSEANKAVFRLALRRSGAVGAPDGPASVELLQRVRRLGLARLADVLEDRLCDVAVEEVSDRGSACLALFTPFDDAFLADLRTSAPLRRWSAELKAWLIPADRDSKARAYAAVRRHFSGRLGRGPKGPFAVEPLELAPRQAVLPLLPP